MKEVKNHIWLKVNDKYILVVNDDWCGEPVLAYPPDILMISKETLEKYRDCITKHVLKTVKKIVYI